MIIIEAMKPTLARRLIELRFDDLRQRPVATLEFLALELGLERFPFDTSVVRPAAGASLYRSILSPEEIDHVEQRCARYMAAYGYSSILARKASTPAPC